MGSSNRQRRIIQASGKLPKWPGKTELEYLDKRYWTIIGKGSIGAKAEELRRKIWPIIAAGFAFHHRFVLTMGFFNNFKRTGEFNSEEIETARKILRELPKTPLVVRSSAHADCLGTGIYRSEFIVNNKLGNENLVDLLNAIKIVLASEFSANGIAFRKNMSIPDGMAIMIEPVFGIKYDNDIGYENGDGTPQKEDVFAPVYGGIGYTSTSYSGPLAGVGAGIPVNVMETGGLITQEGDGKTPNQLFDDNSFWKEDERAIYSGGNTFRELIDGHGIELEHGRLISVGSPKPFFFELDDMPLDWLFSRLRCLEQLIDRPQRIEWAMIEEQSRQKTDLSVRTIVNLFQIGEIDKKGEFYHFSDSEGTIMKSRYVKGTDIRECNGFVVALRNSELELLRQYNEKHKGYLIAFSETMTANYGPLEFNHLSNSTAVAEIHVPKEEFKPRHSHPPISHFGGALEANNILYMVINEPDLEKIWEKRKVIKGKDPTDELWVFEGKFRVTMSEAQQQAVVEVID